LKLAIFFGFKSIKRAHRRNKKEELCLEVGSGHIRREGWITSDFLLRAEVILDARSQWKLDKIFSFIYTEMMIASLSPTELDSFLSNCFQSLKPGGVLRISTVNIRKYAEIYLSDDLNLKIKYFDEMKSRHPGSSYLFDFPDLLRYPFVTHDPGKETYAYDLPVLTEKLNKVGFDQVQLREPGLSNYCSLSNLEKRRSFVLDNLQLVIEATKN
jgi:hypothetical protein